MKYYKQQITTVIIGLNLILFSPSKLWYFTGSSRRRTASASSKDNKEKDKEKDKEKEEVFTDDAEIIYPPKHLLKWVTLSFPF